MQTTHSSLSPGTVRNTDIPDELEARYGHLFKPSNTANNGDTFNAEGAHSGSSPKRPNTSEKRLHRERVAETYGETVTAETETTGQTTLDEVGA